MVSHFSSAEVRHIGYNDTNPSCVLEINVIYAGSIAARSPETAELVDVDVASNFADTTSIASTWSSGAPPSICS